MKLWIDTANVEEIKKYVEMGICEGVTTNPQWIADDTSKKTFKKIVKEICDICSGPVSAEAVAETSAGMIEQARELSKIASNVVVKIPMTAEGIKAIKQLSKE